MRNTRPIVSFSFDDFPKSAVVNGAGLLASRGVAGTFYFCETFRDREVDGIKYYETSDLRALIDGGHEIGCHTASHIRVPRYSSAEIGKDLDENSSFLRGVLDDYKISTFAYPFGDMSVRSKLLLQKRFPACRSTNEGLNVGSVDLGALRASRLYSARTDEGALRALIKQAAATNAWLNLYTHDVDDKPNPFGCTPALLQSAIDMAQQAGCEILTVKNALGAIGFRA
ncbi:polysaccharide deacetylase family protein [Rhodoblastus sp.]|uniref:polysaccharide deacetylase family protein n=1 Tax=Rhodoblastus sp. TaxID=1962975 RepID=UPI003F98E66B